MPQYVRTIDEIGNWERNSDPRLTWMEDNDFQSNIMRDLRPISNNSLSLFAVTDEVDANRIAVAIAAGKQNIDKCDYVILESDALEDNGFKVTQQAGSTRDDKVNAVHFNLIELGVGQLITLAEIISDSIESGQHYRLFDSQIEQQINLGLNTGDLKSVPPRLKRELLRRGGANACVECSHTGTCSVCEGVGYIET